MPMSPSYLPLIAEAIRTFYLAIENPYGDGNKDWPVDNLAMSPAIWIDAVASAESDSGFSCETDTLARNQVAVIVGDSDSAAYWIPPGSSDTPAQSTAVRPIGGAYAIRAAGLAVMRLLTPPNEEHWQTPAWPPSLNCSYIRQSDLTQAQKTQLLKLRERMLKDTDLVDKLFNGGGFAREFLGFLDDVLAVLPGDSNLSDPADATSAATVETPVADSNAARPESPDHPDAAPFVETTLIGGGIGAGGPNPPGGPITAIVFVSPGVYRIGEGDPFKVDACYDEVLRPFLEQPAMDKRELVNKSGHNDAPRVLGRLRKKFDGRFAPFIHLPGKKGNLGYRVTIRQNQPAVERAPITHP